MAKRKYPHLRGDTDRSESYEIVQLLRVNGAQITRDGVQHVILRMGHQGKWNKHRLSLGELRKRYGYGTAAYDILRRHPRASSVQKIKHMDLVA